MWKRAWIVFLVLGALCGMGARSQSTFPSSQNWERNRYHLPDLPNALLLVGRCPFFIEVTRDNEFLRLLPEPGGPGQGGDHSPIYPSLSRDGKVAAYAAVRRGGPPRKVAITTYSLIDNKRTVYAEGDYTGSVAISPDASKLAFSAAKQNDLEDNDGRLHMIDLKTGQETIGPEAPDAAWVIASWSPDSRRLAYDFAGEIRVWNTETGAVTKIADAAGAPAWSPSGEWIAYYPAVLDPETSRILKRPIYARGRWGARLLVVHPDGTGGKTLFAVPDPTDKKITPRRFFQAPVWSPGSQSILINEWTGDMDATVNIHMLDLRTLKLKTILKHTTEVHGWSEAKDLPRMPPPQSGQNRPGLGTLPGAVWLMGYPPYATWLSTSGGTMTVQPAAGESLAVAGPWIAASITREGKVVATLRVKSQYPRRRAVATYSVADGRWTEYAEGGFLDAVAISPDGGKLAYVGDGEETNCGYRVVRVHVIDRKTLREAVEPMGPCIPAKDRVKIALSSASSSSSRLMGMSFSPQGDQLALGSGPIRVWDLDTNTER